MSNPVKALQAWRSRREQRSLEKWAQDRIEGKTRYVARNAFYYSIAFLGMNDAVFRIFYGESTSLTLVRLATAAFFGIYVANSSWSEREHAFQQLLHEARTKALLKKS